MGQKSFTFVTHHKLLQRYGVLKMYNFFGPPCTSVLQVVCDGQSHVQSYVEQGLCNGMMSHFICWSICLSRHGLTAANPLLHVCCCGPGRQEILISCCPACSSSSGRQIWVVSHCQHLQEAVSAYCRETLRQIDSPVMCRKLAVYDRWTDLVIHTAMDNCVIIDDICKFCLHLLTVS